MPSLAPKLGFGCVKCYPDSSEPSSMPYQTQANVISPIWHNTEVIYPGHMQWKGFWTGKNCSTMPSPAPNFGFGCKEGCYRDGSDPSSIPFHTHSNVISPIWLNTKVIYPGHMQLKGILGRPDCSTAPTLTQKLESGPTVWNRYPHHFTNLQCSCTVRQSSPTSSPSNVRGEETYW